MHAFMDLKIVRMSKSMLSSFMATNSDPLSFSSLSFLSHWQVLEPNFVKVNFDVTIFENQKCMGVGVVIRDEVGYFLSELAVRAPILMDAQLTETFVASQTVRLAVVQAMNSDDLIMSYVSTFIADVKRYLNLCSL